MAGDFADYSLMFGPAARAECYEVAQAIVDEIRLSPLTPVRTGKLLRGYKARKTITGASVATSVGYWIDVEYGTENMAAEPHIRPSLSVVKAQRR